MGLISGIIKTAVTVAKNIDKVDSISEVYDKLPDKLDKAKDIAGKTLDFVLDKKTEHDEKKREQEIVLRGYENEKRVKILSEKLLNIEYSVSPKYDRLFPVGDGIFAADKDGKYGVIDINDNVIIPFEYGYMNSKKMNDGLISVSKDGMFGFINIKNEVVIDFQFSDVGMFSMGLAPVAIDNEHWGYIDKNGKFVVEPQFYTAQYFRSNGLAVVSHKFMSEYGVIDINGNIIVKPSLDNILIHKEYIEGVSHKNGYNSYYFDLKGNPITDQSQCEKQDVLDNDDEFQCWWNANPTENIYVYNDSNKKYGWFEKVDGECFCIIKPMFDAFMYTKYSPAEGGYSIIKYADSYGIIKIGEIKC